MKKDDLTLMNGAADCGGTMKRLETRARLVRRIALFLTLTLATGCLLSAMPAYAQSTNASVSGMIVDPGGARIVGARISLVNQSSKSARVTVADKEGVFNFSGVSAGTYTLTVKATSFETFIEKEINLHPGDKTSLPVIAMRIGVESISVTVTAHDFLVTNGEVSSLITADDIKHLATTGRDVTELVKILPGFALQPGAVTAGGGIANTSPAESTLVVGPGGSLGNYTANGAPSGGVALISDGSNVQDPGDSSATTQTINMDMVEEVKVTTSNFGADSAKGPVVINAVGKSGGDAYHGSVYINARTYQLNSQDWLIKNQGQPKPEDRYLYPGASFSGPVKIPGTDFNHSKKLVFLVGAEDYVQRNTFSGGSGPAALVLSTVPTDAMRGGDFSSNALAGLFNVSPADLATECPSGALGVFSNYCQSPSGVTPKGNPVANGVFPAADIDPGAAAYLALFPHANRVARSVLGTPQISDGKDRQDLYLTNNNLYQVRGRVDYDASENSKFYVVYNTEQGLTYIPSLPYSGPATNGNGMIADPSLIKGGTNSQTGSANYVHTFGPTLTNEAFAALSFYFNPFNPVNQSRQTTTALNYPYASSLLNNGTKQIPQLGYSSGIPLYLGPDFTQGEYYSRKQSIDLGDNLTKTWRTHTFKLGFYFERTANNQRTAGYAPGTQGQIANYGNYNKTWYSPNFHPGGIYTSTTPANGTSNTISDFMFGDVNAYGQGSVNPIEDMNYKTIDGYVTDSWKVLPRLTLEVGVRLDHLGPWTDTRGVGAAFWEPQTYSTPAFSASTPISSLPGLTWHGINSRVPVDLQPGRWAFVSPRASFALDMYGDGKTVFTGGGGMYRSHDSWNDYAGALATPLGSYFVSLFNVSLYCVDQFSKSSAAANAMPACTQGQTQTIPDPNNPLGTIPNPKYVPLSITSNALTASEAPTVNAADPNDNQQPLTVTYSVGINQALPHSGNLVINYAGNQSTHLLNGSGGQNMNTIPLGGLFRPNPNPVSPNYGSIGQSPDSIQYVDDYRPYPFYNSINVVRHSLKSNYNALQATWSKWIGPFHYNVNYTWSKALGDRGADGNGNVPDPTNYRNDYAITAYDRTHAFNASYTYIMGSPFHGSRIVSGFINAWEISGITNIQSGPNLQAAYGNNFQLSQTSNGVAQGTTGAGSNTDNKTYLGTPDISLQPIMTCDPSAHLKPNQFVNGSCLTLGPVGVNGPFRYPYMRGPHFFNSDLSVQKTFHLREKRSLDIRFAAFNFMNHPLTSLVAATNQPMKLFINGAGGTANSAFASSAYKQNRRICEVGLHYNF
jgi:hypothetical protein